jgi:hypothetical protein
VGIEKRLTALYQRRKELDAKSKGGNLAAREDRAKVGAEIRAIEHEGNKSGRVYTTVADRLGNVTGTTVEHADSKRDLQRDYVRQIQKQSGGAGEEQPVMIDGKPQRLSDYHRKRLGL